MRKKLSLVVLAIVFLVILSAGFITTNIFAAKCTQADGTVCIGECCKLTVGGCVAGPCDKIL